MCFGGIVRTTIILTLLLFAKPLFAEEVKVGVKLNIGKGQMIVNNGHEICQLTGPVLHTEISTELVENEDGVFVGDWEHEWNFGTLHGKYLVRIRRFPQPNPRPDINIRIVEGSGRRLAEATIPSLAVDQFDFPAVSVKAALNDDPRCPDAVWLTLQE
jgi:hypothetical protein